jgi:hypothetical protein
MAWEHHRFTILQVRTRLDGATILCSRLNPGRIKTSRRTSTTDSPDIHQEFTSTAITQLLAITMNLGTPLLPFKAGGNPEYSPSSSPSFPTNPSLNVLGRPFPVHSPFHTGYTAQNLHSPRYQPQSKIVVTTHHRGSANRQDTRACQAIIRLAIPEHPWIVIQRNRRSLMRMTMMMSSECIWFSIE